MLQNKLQILDMENNADFNGRTVKTIYLSLVKLKVKTQKKDGMKWERLFL